MRAAASRREVEAWEQLRADLLRDAPPPVTYEEEGFEEEVLACLPMCRDGCVAYCYCRCLLLLVGLSIYRAWRIYSHNYMLHVTYRVLLFQEDISALSGSFM